MEHFTINGSLFLAFANYQSDTAEEYNTDSFIYKFNDLTGKFVLYQTIGTHGGHDVEYFTISGEHYLAVANVYDGTTHRLNSVIYRWNGTLFVAFQGVATIRGASMNFFTIEKEPFLAVSNLNANSVIYKWKNNTFEKFQEIATGRCRASAAFVINNESYIAFANEVTDSNLVPLVVYKWSGKHFGKFQTLRTNGAMDVKSFYIKDHVFLAIATQSTHFNSLSFIYKWNGSQFVLFQFISTLGARAWYPFVICGQTFLGVANQRDISRSRYNKRFNIKSVVYRASGDQFAAYQKISTFGATDMTSFEYKGYTYLAIANSWNDDNQRNIDSTLYKCT